MKDNIYSRVEMEHHLCIQVCPLLVKSALQDKKYMNKSKKTSTGKKEELKMEKEGRDY
jgi:hypothetical protein